MDYDQPKFFRKLILSFTPNFSKKFRDQTPIYSLLSLILSIVVLISVILIILVIIRGKIPYSYTNISGILKSGSILLVSYVILISAIQIFVWIFKGQGTITDTINAITYSLIPAIISFPIVNILGIVYSIVISIIAIKNYHSVSEGKAILIVLIPVIALIIYLLYQIVKAFPF